MSIIASEIMAFSAQIYLNDSVRSEWTNTKLLPYIKMAYLDLQAEMQNNQVVELDEVSASITVTAGVVSLTAAAILPSDIVTPIRLHERASTSENWHEMEQKSWEPNDSYLTHNSLDYWTWRESDIKFRGANATVYVLIEYLKSLSNLVDENSIIPIPGSIPFLTARTASYASGFGGGNTERGSTLFNLSNNHLATLIAIQIKGNQITVRKRPYGFSRR